MRSVVVESSAKRRLVIADADEPLPAPSEALIRVSSFSLNLGETRRTQTADDGWRPGWDLAGTVETPASDGSGPTAGNRVVGFVPSGAWAELVAVPTDALAVLPDSVSFAQASTLPVAGLTAMYGLDRNGSILGRRVLITGANGGVGHFACQLARNAGAHVVGLVRRPERDADARDAGAAEIIVGADREAAAGHGPYDLVLEGVGGDTLSMALTVLAPGGMCVLYGVSSGAEFAFNAREHLAAGAAQFYRFTLFREIREQPASEGLTRLVEMVADGSVVPKIDHEAPWTNVAEVAGRLLDREISGKAVLHIS